MEDNGVSKALAGLIDTDLSVADHDALAEASRAVARVQSFVDHAKVQINRRTRALAAEGDTNATHVLLDEARLTGQDAKANDERDRVCETLPEFEDALASGACTAGHLDALATHTKGLSDAERADLADVVDDLVGSAASDPVGLFDRKAKEIVDKIREMHRPGSDADELDRQRKASKVKRWTDQTTGMRNTMLSLDPIRDASLWKVIDHHLTRLCQEPGNEHRPFHELQVEAVLAAVQPGDPSTRIPEIVVHTDLGTCCHGRHDTTLCETDDGVSVPVSTLQRLCCEAVIQAVIVNPDGTTDRLCEELRTASRKQRRLLEAMYSTCAHPHCRVAFSQCRVHHIVWWTRGGKTVLANLLPLCEQHHHLVHEGGWSLTMDGQRRVTWIRPDGTVWLVDDGPNRRSTVPASQVARSTGQRPPTRPARPPAKPPTPPPAVTAVSTPASTPGRRPPRHRPAGASRRSDDPAAAATQATLL